MTVSIEKVKATIVDDIELFCSNDGKRTGMSQSGLARFTGIPKRTMSRIIEAITFGGTVAAYKGLEHLALVDIYVEKLVGASYIGSVSVIKAEICAEICAWAAYEYNGGNKTARFSLKKFAASGIQKFIQEATGFETIAEGSTTNDLLLSLMGEMQTDMRAMNLKLTKADNYFKARIEWPGMEQWIEESGLNDIEMAIEGTPELFTLNEAIAKIYPGTVLSKPHKTGLSRSISEVYKAMKLAPPVQVIRLNKVGYNSPPVNAFPETMFPIIKACFGRLVQL
jgi:hypothetical protein